MRAGGVFAFVLLCLASLSIGARDMAWTQLLHGAGDEWLAALEPIGTGVDKPHLTDAPWLIVVFAQRFGMTEDGRRPRYYEAGRDVPVDAVLMSRHLGV